MDPLRTPAAIETHLPRVDAILDSFRATIGKDFDGYRNHVYRVVNLCQSLGDFSAIEREKIQIAGSFHDVGIWTAGTAAYLAPSAQAARAYLAANDKAGWAEELSEIIEMHHGIRSCAGSRYALVEPFRRADIADFSLGMVRMGIPNDLIRRLKSTFPNRGFHKLLARLGARWVLRHPLNPLPMYRW